MSKPVKLRPGVQTDVPLSALTPDPEQPRKEFPEQDLQVLAASIKASGVLVPILVRKGDKALVIIDGERRWRAAKLAGKRSVPALLQEIGADDAQRQLDQLAINNNRAPLSEIEIARLIHRLRAEQKLSTTEIAAQLEKRGVPRSPKEISAAGDLLKLPAWAQSMLNDKQIDVNGAKALLIAERDPAVLKAMEAPMRRRAQFGGRVPAPDVMDTLQETYRTTTVDLQYFWGYPGAPRPVVHFEWQKVCRGCEHLRKVGDGSFCMNAEKFAEHNQQAKDAGLQPGGRKPPKAAAARDDDESPALDERVARKEVSHRQRVAEYFDGWLRGAIGALLPTRDDLIGNLVDYYACQMPDGGDAHWDGGDEEDDEAPPRETPRLTRTYHYNARNTARGEDYLKGSLTRLKLSDFIGHPLLAEERLAVAQACLTSLQPQQVLELAECIRFDVGASYSIDADYLDLKTRGQLLDIAMAAGITDSLPAKVGELRAFLLQVENVQKIGLPSDLRDLLDQKPPADEPEDFEDDDPPELEDAA